MNQPSSGTQFLAILGLLASTVVWGFTFIFIKWTLAGLDVYYFLFLRFLIASISLALVFATHLNKTTRSSLRASLALSIFLFLGYAAQTEGLRFTTAGNSALITGLYLVLIPLFSVAFLRRRLATPHIIGALVSVAGLYLLTEFSIGGFNIGDGITLIAATAYAIHIIMTGHYATKHAVVPLVLFQFVFVTIICGAIAGARASFTLELSSVAIVTLITTGLLATTVAFVIQAAAQRIIDPVRTGIIFAMEAVFGALFGYLIGGEMMTMLSFVGACLMVSGMAIAEIKPIAKYLIEKITG